MVREARYEMGFVRQGGFWHLNAVTTTRERASTPSSPARERDPEAEAAVKDLALRWYRDLDPSVCDAMTDRMLSFGWGRKAMLGERSAGRTSLLPRQLSTSRHDNR